METKAICVEPNYPGTRLYEVGAVADLSEIDYKSRHCWEIGGVNLMDITELDDERFYLVKTNLKNIEAVNKQMKEEVKNIESKAKSLEDENSELKLKLAKLEGKAEKKKSASKDVEKVVEKAAEKPSAETKEDIF